MGGLHLQILLLQPSEDPVVEADLSGGDHDGVQDLRRLMEDGGELLLHADRRAAPADISGHFRQIL